MLILIQNIHSGLLEYMCVLDGMDKIVDSNEMELLFL